MGAPTMPGGRPGFSACGIERGGGSGVGSIGLGVAEAAGPAVTAANPSRELGFGTGVGSAGASEVGGDLPPGLKSAPQPWHQGGGLSIQSTSFPHAEQ